MRTSNSTALGSGRMIECLESRRLLVALYLDPTFGEQGTASFPFGSGADTAELIVPLAGGQAMIAGDIDDHAGLLRINADGSLDTTFGTGGIATDGPKIDQIHDVVQLDSGKFLFAGEALITHGQDLIVMRFNSNGTIDTSFGGGDGVVTVTFGADLFSRVAAMAVDANDRIVLVGNTREQFVSSIAVVRLLANGTSDTTFSGDGKQILEGQTGTSVAIQADGRILVGGYTRDTNLAPTGAFVYRLRANGSVDTTFDEDGKRDIAYSGTNTELGTLLLQPSGKILVGGATTLVNTSSGAGLITRLNTDGSTDTTFGQSGTHFFGTEPADAGQMRFDNGGNIVAIHREHFVRVDENGTPDPTVGNGVDGVLLLDVQSNDSMALVDDNTILIGGGSFRVSRLAARPNLLFTDGNLFITGGEGDDTISLDLNGNDLDVTRNGVTSTISAPVQSIDIELHGGADQVTIDPDLEASLRADLGEGNNSFLSGGMILRRLMTGSGNDTITMSVANNPPGGFSRPPITTGAGNDSITLGDQPGGIDLNAGAGNDTVLLGAGDELFVHGGDGDDQITATSGHTALDGDGGNDTINGGSDRDDINGGEGNDLIDAGGGNDVVQTGEGFNTAMGGAGDDTLLGGVLADSLVGGDGNDSLGAGNGANTVFGGAGNDILRGGNDYDWMWGESGYDTMKGGLGGDFLHGGNGKDKLFGQEGNDRMYGSGNDDVLDGGSGSDLMVAGDGNDKLWGDDGEEDTLDGGTGSDQADIDLLDQQTNLESILA